jgi:hypothetical protein
MSRADLEAALWAILDALREYEDDLVLVWGWVPYLHLTYGRAASEDTRTSLTAEADLVVPRNLRRGDRPPIASILEKAGFQRIGGTRVIWARDPERGETIEFLQSHRGPAQSRGGAASVPEQPDLQALSLEGLWILEAFTEPLLVPAPSDARLGSPGATSLSAAAPSKVGGVRSSSEGDAGLHSPSRGMPSRRCRAVCRSRARWPLVPTTSSGISARTAPGSNGLVRPTLRSTVRSRSSTAQTSSRRSSGSSRSTPLFPASAADPAIVHSRAREAC